MNTLQDLLKKANDHSAQIASLSSGVDELKTKSSAISTGDQAVIDEIGTVQDANSQALNDLQTKVTGP